MGLRVRINPSDRIEIMSDETNPSAFPQFARLNNKEYSTGGMTLRDYFAGQALIGLLASPHSQSRDQAAFAECAYITADAMMERRKQ